MMLPLNCGAISITIEHPHKDAAGSLPGAIGIRAAGASNARRPELL